jgi:hypothetical protein
MQQVPIKNQIREDAWDNDIEYIFNDELLDEGKYERNRGDNLSDESMTLSSYSTSNMSLRRRGDGRENRLASNSASLIDENGPILVGNVPIGKVRCSQLTCSGEMECSIS